MCSKEDCNKHELWGGMCRDHLVEALGEIAGAKPKRKRRTKKVDAVEVITTDDTAELIERGVKAAEERIDNDK